MSTITQEQTAAIAAKLEGMALPRGLGDEHAACSIAAINFMQRSSYANALHGSCCRYCRGRAMSNDLTQRLVKIWWALNPVDEWCEVISEAIGALTAQAREIEALKASLEECVEDTEAQLAAHLEAYGERYRVERVNYFRKQISTARALLAGKAGKP